MGWRFLLGVIICLQAAVLNGCSNSAKLLAPSAFSGRVLDRVGNPVSGARVVLAGDNPEREVGAGKADREGRFKISPSGEIQSFSVDVSAPSFARWAMCCLESSDSPLDIRLDRHVDERFVRTVLGEQSFDNWAPLLVEIVGKRQFSLMEEQFFPMLGALRSKLREFILAAGVPGIEADDLAASRERARELLWWWGEEEDRGVWQPLETDPKHLHEVVKGDCGGSTIREAVMAWTLLHDPGHKGPWPVLRIVDSDDHTRALARCDFRYMHWGYEMTLILRRLEGRWQVRLAFESLHYDLMARDQ